MDLVLGLPVRDQAALSTLIEQLYDPNSVNYHQYLTPEQFAERFGPTEQDYQAVIRFARMHGLTVTATHPNRTLINVNGAVADIERAFHVTLRTYQHPTENRIFFAPDTEPTVDLDVPLLAISGLDNYIVPRPLVKTITADKPHPNVNGSGPGGYYLGYDFRHAYAPGVALDGAGQSVGLVEFDGYYPHDVAAYKALAGLPDVPVNVVLLDGFNGSAGGANIEVSLDIDMAIAMAPGLNQVLVYEGLQPNSVLNRIATDRIARQISASWTYSINATTVQIFQQFAAQGQSFYNSSGDSGAYAGAVSTPADNPYVIVVGGTLLTTVAGGGSWVSETAWPYSSGGISTTYPIPTWQQGISMSANQGSTTMRNLPDVSMIADNVWIFYNNGTGTAVGGTSVSAPLWAGYTALINQLALANGEPLVGFINPAVYAFGKSSTFTSLFHDIITGNNENASSPSKFIAVSGYDLCTGWGTPAGSNLITALALPEPLRISPGAATIISGPVGGPFNPATQIFSLTNNAAGTLNWTLISTSAWLNVSPTSGALVPGGPAATVTLSPNAAASNLVAGSYTTTLRFTNLSTGFGQSRVVTLAVVTPPVITAQPADQPVLQGANATFTVGTGPNALLYYRWLDNGVPLTDGGKISGSTTSTLVVSNVSSLNVGAYSVIVSNAAGVVTSLSAALTIVPSAPVITLQPTNQSILPGAPVTLNVAAVGNTPFFYQWKFNDINLVNGLNLSGASSAALTISNVSPANAGTYSVIVSNSLGATASTGAVLSVIPVTIPGVTLTTLSSFGSGNDGENPFSPVTQGRDGNFYGTTLQGGANGYGTVFRLTPAGARTTLLSFNYTSLGGIAYAGLDLGRDGNFYLPLAFGDTTYGDGTVIRVTSSGVGTTLARFNSNNGLEPVAGLVQGADGSFYGTTVLGGAYGYGTVFKMTSGGFLTTLISFNWNNGAYPSSVLIQGSDASFYGTTENGGTNGAGTVFKVTSAGLFTSLHSFNGSDGSVPFPGLFQASDGYLYGNTLQGGTNGGFGTVFKIAPSGVFTSLYSFAGDTDGANPWGGLVQASDGNLYGTAQAGGAYNFGTIFRLAPHGALAKLADFDGYNGAAPSAAMIQDTNGSLYGTTQTGGSSGFGAIFRVNIDAPLQITGQPADQELFLGETAAFNVATFGTAPISYQWRKSGQNLVDGGNISGSTTRTLTISNAALTNVGTYSVVVSNASGSLTSLGAVLEIIYSPPFIIGQPSSQTRVTGSTATFTVDAEGDEPLSYQWLMNGTNLLDGGNVSGSATSRLTISSVSTANAGTYSVIVSNLFDIAQSIDAVLTVVSPTPPGVAAATLHSFLDSTDGAFGYSGLMQGRDGLLYGTASGGGTRFYGTVFRMTLSGGFSTLYAFTDGNFGATPYGPLVQPPNNFVYGTTFSGGTNGYGTVFRLTTSGVMTFLHSFIGGTDGAYPYAGLALGADGNLYGTTYQGGANSFGGIYKLTQAGTFNPFYSFTDGQDGAFPYAGLTLGSDSKLYGTTLTGGSNGYGTVFRLNTNASLTTLASFGYTNGASPQAGVVQGLDGKFYGVTYAGGAYGYGTVFQLDTNGVLTTLYSFDYTNGANPLATLARGTDGNFYGTTYTGGPGGEGTAFRITPAGAFTTLMAFDGFNGAGPQGALLQANDGFFYGTTTYGGVGYNRTSGGGFGLVYRLTVPIFASSPFTMPSPIAAVPYIGNISGQARSAAGDALAFAKVSGPGWLSVSNDGTISGTPGIQNVGTNTFMVSLADANGFYATATMLITVSSNRPPSFFTSTFTQPWANVDQPYSGSFATNATDPDLPFGDVLSFAKVSGPAWLNVAADGSLSGTPQGLEGGTNTFVVSATDLAGSSSTATMYVYVNSTPYFLARQFTKPAATIGLAYSGTIATNATDPDLGAGDYLTFYKVNGPTWLTIASDGSLSGVPQLADLGPGISLVLVVDSGGLAGVGYLGITIVTNSPPLFASNPFIAPGARAGVAYAASIAGFALDPDLGDSLTFAKVNGPAWLSVSSNGALSGTPNFADSGTNSFLVSVTDQHGLVSQAAMNLVVVGPVVLSISTQAGQISLSWTGGNPPYLVESATNFSGSPAWSNFTGPLATNRLFLVPSNAAACYRVIAQ
jgi:uncharacterized repeat protein (TIGR03803 family)